MGASGCMDEGVKSKSKNLFQKCSMISWILLRFFNCF